MAVNFEASNNIGESIGGDAVQTPAGEQDGIEASYEGTVLTGKTVNNDSMTVTKLSGKN